MKNKFKFLISNFLRKYGYFKIEDLQAGGHCGLCGKWVDDCVVEKYWPWTACESCRNGWPPKDDVIYDELSSLRIFFKQAKRDYNECDKMWLYIKEHEGRMNGWRK